MTLLSPIAKVRTCTINATLHGRSIHRPADVPGHNVFRGYTTWANNSHVGVGDAIDFGGFTGQAVYAVADGTITRHDHDGERLEVLYIAWGDGNVAVYAHLNNAKLATVGTKIKAGETLGFLRPLNQPHLHFELWLNGQAVHASTPEALRAKIVGLCTEVGPVRCIDLDTQEVLPYVLAEGGNHIADQGKLYLRRKET